MKGEERLDVSARQSNEPVFYAIVTNEWISGMAPIFAVQVNGKWELRRRPARGQENFTEPLFFALPPVDEPNVARLSGRWTCRAASEDGSKNHPALELALEGETVAGRFDPNTDYRFAFITGGRFRGDELELRVEYIKETYLLKGTWNSGRIKGTWVRSDESDKGTWEAERPPSAETSKLERQRSKDLVALYEWRRSDGDSWRYELEERTLGPGWIRSQRPICRVWKNP